VTRVTHQSQGRGCEPQAWQNRRARSFSLIRSFCCDLYPLAGCLSIDAEGILDRFDSGTHEILWLLVHGIFHVCFLKIANGFFLTVRSGRDDSPTYPTTPLAAASAVCPEARAAKRSSNSIVIFAASPMLSHCVPNSLVAARSKTTSPGSTALGTPVPSIAPPKSSAFFGVVLY
jgi:hypothetical protein